MKLLSLCLLWLLVAAFPVQAELASRVDPEVPARRVPEDLIISPAGDFLLSANRASGTLSVIDPQAGEAVAEWQIGQSLVHLLALPKNRVLALDSAANEAVLLHIAGSNIEILSRAKVPYSPIRAVDVGDQIVVSCIWPRKLVSLRLAGNALEITGEQVLPFAPRELLYLERHDTLLAADNFGGQLGLIDPNTLELRQSREFPAHHIRAMLLSQDGKSVIFAHQMLNSRAVTNSNDIHWGLLMSNELRWLSVERILDPQANFYAGGFMHPIGQAAQGSGDPTDVALVGEDQTIITLGGTSEFALAQHRAYGLYRGATGRRPTAVIVAPDAKHAYIANGFDDSISVIDLNAVRQARRIPLGARKEPTPHERGEQLFYDSKLSMEGWMSCHSCHTDGHTNGLANDNFGDNSFGAPKRVLSLLGKHDTAPFSWLATSETMSAQIHKSIERTMQGRELPQQDVAALVAYVESLPLPPSIDELQGTHDPAAVARGRLIFLRQNCVKCHAPPTFTSPQTYDVGLSDEEGNHRFNPPSLRGVGHRTSFFHNAEAAHLRDVFESYQHGLHDDLSAEQLDDLLSFLRSL